MKELDLKEKDKFIFKKLKSKFFYFYFLKIIEIIFCWSSQLSPVRVRVQDIFLCYCFISRHRSYQVDILILDREKLNDFVGQGSAG